MNPWPAPLFQHWYAVARSDRLGRKPLAVSVLDRPLVLARDGAGGLLALEDRCPHRQVALSDGCVRHGRLQCPYHGWSFDADGRLRDIPGLPDGQPLPAVKVRSYPLLEHDGLLWLRPSTDGEAAPSALARELPPASRRFLWQTRWPAHVLDAMENFLDPLHTHFLHPGLVRQGDRRQRMQVRLRCRDDGFSVDYRGQGEQSGWLYRLFESRRSGEHAHFALPGSARIEYRYASGARVCITLHFTPHSATATDVFATLHVQGRIAPRWAVRLLLWPLLRKVGEQDRRMLERQAWNQARFPGRHGASSPLDLVRAPLEAWWLRGERPQPGERDIELML